MKKLTYMGQEVNPKKAHEYNCVLFMGFKVTVQYASDGNYSHLSQKPVVFNNVSEFHNLWRDGSVAIESDNVHGTGRTNDWEDIDWVTIEMSEKLEDCFSTYNQ